MWRRAYPALVSLSLACSAMAQWSEIWTNGDLFAVEQMASQCYSASVERCIAAGVTPDSPSWSDYILGKNRAKLLSVKRNIRNSYFLYVKPSCTNILQEFIAAGLTNSDDVVTRAPLDLIWSDAWLPVCWSNESDFLNYAGLPETTFDETPYFKSQYPSTTGGWRSVWMMLTNLHTTIAPIHSELRFWYSRPHYETNGNWGYFGTRAEAVNWSLANQTQREWSGPFTSQGHSFWAAAFASRGSIVSPPSYGWEAGSFAYTGRVGVVATTNVSKTAEVFLNSRAYQTGSKYSAQGFPVTNGWCLLYAGATNSDAFDGLAFTNVAFLSDLSFTNNEAIHASEYIGFRGIDGFSILHWTAGFRYK